LLLNDTNIRRYATISFDYAGLGLGTGDSFTIDVTGVFEPASTTAPLGRRTTAAALSGPGVFKTELVDFEFDASLGPSQRTFTFGSTVDPPVVPEPSTGIIVMMLGCVSMFSLGRRRRKVSL
jgi:hypothetical protein